MTGHDETDVVFGLEKAPHAAGRTCPGSPDHRHGSDDSNKNDHLASLYDGPDEQFTAVVPFIRRGLDRGEQCLYVADDNSKADVLEALRAGGVAVQQALDSEALVIHTKADTYVRSGTFEQDAMLQFWRDALDEARGRNGFEGVRAAAEMTWALDEGTDLDGLAEYEAMLNTVYPGDDYVVMCQYNRNRFSSEVISDVIRTHPFVVSNGTVCRNVYYRTPAEFLDTAHPPLDVDRTIENLAGSEVLAIESTVSEDDRAVADDQTVSPETDPTVLIVEDNRELADLYASWLSDTYAVRTAYDGDDALAHMDDTVDLVVLDRQLPDRSGDEILSHLREQYDCRVAMVTVVDPDPEDTTLAFDDYLTKPVHQGALRTTVERLLELERIPDQFKYVTTLEFELHDPAYPLSRISEELGCRIELMETIQATGDTNRSAGFYRIHGADPERLFDIQEMCDRIETVRILRTADEEYIAELVVSDVPAWTLATMCAILRSVDVADGVARYTAVLPPYRDAESVIDTLQRDHPSIEVTAIRDRTLVPSLMTERTLRTLFADRLTERQREVLELAYAEGYFDRPRATSQEALATALGISQETLSHHLREAQYRVFTVLLGTDPFDLRTV